MTLASAVRLPSIFNRQTDKHTHPKSLLARSWEGQRLRGQGFHRSQWRSAGLLTSLTAPVCLMNMDAVRWAPRQLTGHLGGDLRAAPSGLHADTFTVHARLLCAHSLTGATTPNMWHLVLQGQGERLWSNTPSQLWGCRTKPPAIIHGNKTHIQQLHSAWRNSTITANRLAILTQQPATRQQPVNMKLGTCNTLTMEIFEIFEK